MGESLAARRAGRMPKTIPTKVDTPSANPIANPEILVGKNRLTIKLPPPPIKTPIKPPVRDSKTDSIKNCSRIIRGVAPKAFLNPISRVRSVTVTSIMFMTPIPPTTKLIAAIPDNPIVKVPITD